MNPATLLMLSLLGQSVTPPANQFAPMVEFGVRGYDIDGRGRSYAGVSENESGFAYMRRDLCGVGATRLELSDPADKAFAWRLTSRTIEHTQDTWVVDIEWQRVIDNGKNTPSSPKGSRRLTLRTGDHVVIENISPATPGTCPVAEVRLEAGIGLWPARVTGATAGSGAGFGARGGSSAGQGGGIAVGASGGSGGFGSSLAAAGGSGGAVGPPLLTAELWLVHTRPDGIDEGRRLEINVAAGTNGYEFPTLPIDGVYGKVNVQVRGFVRPTVSNGEVSSLTLWIVRSTRLDQDARANSVGAATKAIPLPKPMDVVAIEMPRSGTGERDLLAGHQFSLRLRVSPAK